MTDPNRCANLYDLKEVLGDCLSSQKQITAAYNTFAGECVDPRLRNAFLNIMDEEHCIQADIFRDLNARGWYLPEQAEQQKISQTKNKLTQGESECGSSPAAAGEPAVISFLCISYALPRRPAGAAPPCSAPERPSPPDRDCGCSPAGAG